MKNRACCPVCGTVVQVAERLISPSVLACRICLRLLDVSNPLRPRGVKRLRFRAPRVASQDLRLTPQEHEMAQDVLTFTEQSMDALLTQPANPSSDLYGLRVLAEMVAPMGEVLVFARRQTLADLTTATLHLARHAENPGTPPHLPTDQAWLVHVTQLHRVLLNRVVA